MRVELYYEALPSEPIGPKGKKMAAIQEDFLSRSEKRVGLMDMFQLWAGDSLSRSRSYLEALIKTRFSLRGNESSNTLSRLPRKKVKG